MKEGTNIFSGMDKKIVIRYGDENEKYMSSIDTCIDFYKYKISSHKQSYLSKAQSI